MWRTWGRTSSIGSTPSISRPDRALCWPITSTLTDSRCGRRWRGGNAGGSGEPGQPRADLPAIRQDRGPSLEVRAPLTDPQNEILTGTVAIDAGAGDSGQAAHRSPAPAGAIGLIVPFAGRLPRSIALDALSPGAVYRLTITATDGNTKPAATSGDF